MDENNLVVVNQPSSAPLVVESDILINQAEALVVNDLKSHTEALEGYILLKRASKRITEHYEPTRAALEKAKKELLRARDEILAPIEKAMKIISGKASTYEAEERRRAAEAARILEEAERARLEEEKLAQAVRLEKAGATDLVDVVLDQPIEIKPVEVAPETAKVAGISERLTYHAEVFDMPALARYAGQNPEMNLTLPNMPILNALAREQKETLTIPGVRVNALTVRMVR